MKKASTILCSCLLAWSTLALGQSPRPKKLELYILVGQSNMAGRGKIDSIFVNEGNDHVLMFNRAGEWVKAHHPVHFDKPKAAGVGPGLAFGIDMAIAHPRAQIGLIPCAVGGTAIERWQPGAYDAATKTHPYDDAVERIKKAMAYGVVKGIIWHQGEANSSPQNSVSYLAQLKELVGRLRALVGNPKLPFIVGELGTFRKAFVQFNNKLDSVPLLIPYAGLASSKGLVHKGDSTHFDGNSAQMLGKRFAAEMIRLQHQY
ncbi:sialate O-acetylesterase [Pedobacter sp. PWIIR3]